MKRVIIIVFIMLIATKLFAQESGSAADEKFEPEHSLGLTIGNEHVFGGRDDNGEKKTLILPFYGLDYNFQFAPKFAIGLHTDFVVESFEVVKNLDNEENESVERTDPVAPAIMGFYKPTKHWSFGLGIGGEFAKEESYALNRLAVEYGSEFGQGWEVSGSLQYDIRWNAYDTYTIGLGISKRLGKARKAD